MQPPVGSKLREPQAALESSVAVKNTVVVVPTFNERDGIAKLIETIFGLYPEIHILVVDDHSPDGTADTVRELQLRYSNLMLLERMENHGFGPSYRDGFRRVLAEPWCRAVVTMDADFSHDPLEIRAMLDRLAECDLVVGSRYVSGGGIGNWSLHRRWLSRGANLYVRALLSLPIRDTTSGFLCMRRESLENLPLNHIESNGYAFLVEMKYLLNRAGNRIVEHPIHFDERREGESKMSAGKVWESVFHPWHTLWRFPFEGEKEANSIGNDRVPAQPDTRRKAGPVFAARDLRSIVLCVLLFLAAVAAINPTVEMGVDDDWSYNHIAREFAATGQIQYNGWAAAMIVPQLIWAAGLIKAFGFSFLALRLSTVLVTVLLIPVLYYLGRDSGLEPAFAAFAALLTVLSPLAMPEAVSFMSDMPALFFFMLCLYCGIRAWRAKTAKSCIAWAIFLAVAGLLGGLSRQVYWLAPLFFLPVIAWVQHGRKGTVIWLGVAWTSVLLSVSFCFRWYGAQPYAINEPWWKTVKDSTLASLTISDVKLVARLALTVALILVPVLAGFVLPGLRAVSRRTAVLVGAGILIAGIPGMHWTKLQAPWLGNILTEHGVIPLGVVGIGQLPIVLGRTVREVVSLAVFLCCAGCGLALWKLRKPVRLHSLSECTTSPFVVLGLAFAGAWLTAVLFRSAGAPAFDRYLLPFLQLAAIPLLWIYQVHIRSRVSRLSWVVLTAFALYGVAATHDAFADARTRLQAAHRLEQAGIPRIAIMAGVEYDGWTQLEIKGHLNYWYLTAPPGAYRKVSCTGPEPLRPWYLPLTTALQVRYFISLSPLPQLADGPAGPIWYTTWLPPGRRPVYMSMLPEGEYVGCR